MKKNIALLTPLAAALGLGLGASSPASAQVAVPGADAQPRLISVTGSAEATAVPDRARLNVAVDVVTPDLATGETKTREVVRNYVAAAKKLGVAEADIQASNYTTNAEYEWRDNRQVFTGYRVRRQVTLTVRDLARIGALLQQATASGMTQIEPPALEASTAREAQRRALASATEDAIAQGQVLARTLTVRLGAPQNVSGNVNSADNPPPRPMFAMARAKAASADGAPSNEEAGFAGGQLRYTATVNVSFTLTP